MFPHALGEPYQIQLCATHLIYSSNWNGLPYSIGFIWPKSDHCLALLLRKGALQMLLSGFFPLGGGGGFPPITLSFFWQSDLPWKDWEIPPKNRHFWSKNSNFVITLVTQKLLPFMQGFDKTEAIFSNDYEYQKPGLHKLWYPGIRDTRTWSKFGAHGEHGDVFLFSNLGALWFSENLIRYSLHVCSREVKNNLFSFNHSYILHFSWRFYKF